MSPQRSTALPTLLIIAFFSSLLVLADLTGFLQWYKDIRSYIVSPIQTVSKETATTISFVTTSILTNNSLKKQNLELKQRILELDTLLSTYKNAVEAQPALQELSASIQKNSYSKSLNAEILDVHADHLFGKLILNKGSSQGVKVGMPVAFGGNYVGYISQVSAYLSVCNSFLLPGQEFIGYVKAKKITGIVRVSVNNIALGDLLATERVSLHDTVTIRREGYPYELALGTISRPPENNGSAEREALLTSSLSLEDLTFVTIIQE